MDSPKKKKKSNTEQIIKSEIKPTCHVASRANQTSIQSERVVPEQIREQYGIGVLEQNTSII